MTTEKKSANAAFPFTPGFWAVIALGGLIGYLLSGDLLRAPYYFLLGTFCAGIAWAYLFIQWAQILGDSIALLKDPIPLDLNVEDRTVVREQLDSLKGGSHTTNRARNLLQSWVLGANPRQVISLASFQSSQASRPIFTGAGFAVILLVVGVFLYTNPWVTWGGLGILALTVFTRQNLMMQIEFYLEQHFLSRLPGNIPQTAMTAADLADALGGSIQKAFKDNVPQPEATANAIKGAVDQVVRRVADEVEKLQQVLVQSQSSLVDRWKQAAEATTTDLKNVEGSLSTIVNDLTGGLSTNADKLNKMFNEHTQEMDKAFSDIAAQIKEGVSGNWDDLRDALNSHAEAVRASGGDWGAKFKDILAEHVNSIEAANHELADQLEKIATLEKNIENVLKIQEVVDGTLKTVAASEEFSKLISTLRDHLEKSDDLLKEVSKPRTIRLIESEGEVEEVRESREAPPKAETKPPEDTTPEAKKTKFMDRGEK